MSRQALLRMLHQRIGLEAESLGERVLHDAFAEARAALGVASDEALYGKALVQPDAFFEIVERFVVPESWFFRAGDQYADLVRYAGERRERRPLRILSLPCASGEEAWSAVITLVDAGWSPDHLDVLGIDVSRAAVARAQAGVYRHSALRGRPLKDTWMQPHAHGFEVAAAIRRSARFRVGNALDPQLFGSGERFDVVFCRNLLIYLHAQARERVLKTLLAALVPGGLLLAGQAEVLNTVDGDLRHYEGGCPLSYVRQATVRSTPARNGPDPRPARRTEPASEPAAVVAPAIAAPAAVPASAWTPQALADAGRLEEAREACGRRLKQAPEDIEILFLLGLIESARADLGAAEAAFAKVCFLDRDNIPAMDHLVALAERSGRREIAGELRKRAQRLRERIARSP